MMIADDEALERRAFKTIVEKDIDLISEIIEAQNGNEAVEKALEYKPDIIVMDVKMPGINGIEAIKKIKQTMPDIHFIVLTAYDDFNYIQEALKIDVDDYLLKPSRRTKIVDSLLKVIEIINTERKKAGLNKTILKKMEKISPIVENQLVSLVMFSGSADLEIKNCLDFLGCKFRNGYAIIVSLNSDPRVDDITTKYILNKEVYDYLYTRLHEKSAAAVGMPYAGRITAVVFETDIASQKQLLLDLKKQFSRDFSIGIGGSFEDRTKMERSYYQALHALRNASIEDEYFLVFDEEAETSLSDYKLRYLAGKEEVLIQKFMTLNEVECFDTIDEIFLWIFKNLSLDFNIVKNYFMGLVALIIKTAAGMAMGKNTEVQLMSRDYYGEISMINDLWELKKWMECTINEALNEIRDVQKKKLMHIIEHIKDYIDENFASNLTLENVSRMFNISHAHLSRIFKIETGLNFIDYITQIRIAKAKALLSETDLTIKEICYDIGFNDPNYFGKVFKKVLGVTPGEYKNNSR